ncbi:MAG: extracellular solute-binding protein [Candidatus Magasanikbacteria bacterium]|nr:extracellular solute-binding protein [Candidatus Magasanikbacteria bacterium]
MPIKPRWFTLLLAAILLTSTGLGCKGLSGAEQAATKPVKLEYWTVVEDVPALQAAVEKYRVFRPYLTVNIRTLRPEEVYGQLIEALAEDRGPDIISLRNRWLGQYLSKLAPLPESIPDTTVYTERGRFSTQTTVTTQTRPLLNPRQLESEYVQAVAKDAVLGGKIYGLPFSLDTMALYYNKDILDRAGVPSPPKTWEEFQAAAKKATRFDRRTGKLVQAGAALGVGSNVPGSDDLFYLLLRQSGLELTDKRTGAAVFHLAADRNAETPVMSVLNFFTDFANPNRDTYTWNADQGNALDAFVSGRLAFFFGYSYHYSQIKSRAPQLNLGVLPMLQLNSEEPVNVANYWVQAVLAKSPRQAAAWGLIDYLARGDANKEYLDATLRPTARRVYVAEQQAKPELKPFVSDVLIAENWYRGKNYEAAARALNDLFAAWLEPVDPQRPFEARQEALNRAAARINQSL